MAEAPQRKSNRLINEKSPYLQQHAYNPVDWYPWGDEAIDRARAENKPIFLSIGYSTCHWCHVMEHESFEQDATAELMNKYFVSIKVDREERPDVDKVYMSAVQAMTGSGGWPLSVFLTPELKPFYGGTYFPPRDAHGRPGFPTVLQRIHEVWVQDHAKIIESGEQLLTLLRQEDRAGREEGPVDESLATKTSHQLAVQYDPRHGGFGNGPKFPRPVVLNFLFRYYAKTHEPEALSMALTTLQFMARGGMYDQIGGGFHRYSVDEQWRVPHFEKMLYDQAQLVISYLEAYQITHDPFYANIARETLDYVLRDMTDNEGAFYSAEDADSPDPANPHGSSEGAFYLWTKDEVTKILQTKDAKIFLHHYGIDEHGNALSDPQGEFQGKNILFLPFTLAQTAEFTSTEITKVEEVIRNAKQRLLEFRSNRPRPLRDDKIITSWNGLMISAFARGSRVLRQAEYLAAAACAASFISKALYNSASKTLKRRYREGEAKFEAHLDDYAFFIQGLLDLYEASGDAGWLKLALDLHGTQIALFWNASDGGFFDFSGKDKTILLRTREAYDGAEPSGNSVAAANLLRLSRITDDDMLKMNAETTLRTFSGLLQHAPHAMPQMIAAMEFFREPPKQIVIAGAGDSPETKLFLEEIADHFLPYNMLLFADGGPGQEFLSKRLSFLAPMVRRTGMITAYVCENYSCDLPVTSVADLASLLDRE